MALWTPPSHGFFRFDAFEVDLRTGELRKSGTKLKIQEQPLKVLAMLLARPGELVTREELRKGLWPNGTFVDFERGLNTAVNRLRGVLNDSADTPRFVETVGKRGYRFIASVSNQLPVASTLADASSEVFSLPRRDADEPGPGVPHLPELRIVPEQPKVMHRLNWAYVAVLSLVGLVGLTLGLAVGGRLFFSRKARALTNKDTIVLADFANTTGDPVFDGTLRQGLSVQLEQSPFLSIISDQEVQPTLQLMGQKPNAKLTPEIARELCQRTASAAVLDGSIAQIGTQYLLTLKAVSCASGESLASAEAQAGDKNHVLDALGKTTLEIRNKLGESLSTMRRFDTPLEQATTTSLDALQAYSLGRRAQAKGDHAAAVPLFQRAIHLDPKFSMAYFSLGASYSGLGETTLGAENTRKAYELRGPLSEREKYFIEVEDNILRTGDLEKARQALELWAQTYPRDRVPLEHLGAFYRVLGQYDKRLAVNREVLGFQPESGADYAFVVYSYLNLNRLEEARATVEEAQAKQLDSPYLHTCLYHLAFLQNDAAAMAQQVAWAVGKPVENLLLANEADTAAYSGRLGEARDSSGRAVALVKRAGGNETAASYEADAALREALFGNAGKARQYAAGAIGPWSGWDLKYGVGLALALAGDNAGAQALADDLAERFPGATLVQFNYLPTLHAQLALNRNDAPKAIQALEAAAPNELGSMGNGVGATYALYPVYVRGEAYLVAHQGREANAEFQKILDHRGIVLNEPIGALAHLQIGRAYALQGDTAKAKVAYQDFLTLWKDADPDIPILIAAKSEYAKLK